MEICIFYSWQSKYRDNCDRIISKAIGRALRDLNKEQQEHRYTLKRGGADVLGSEHIDDNIDRIIKNEVDIAIVDYTHIGKTPQKDPRTGEWIKEKCNPNTNVSYESGKLEYALDSKRLLFKVYNTAYGELGTNIEMPFDMRQEHFPIGFYCEDATNNEERKKVVEKLSHEIKTLLIKCTKEFQECQKVRYSPLVPLHNEYSKKLWQGEFKITSLYQDIYNRVIKGQSFRLLGLPGLGKTRMVGEAFRGRDNDVYYCDCKEQNYKDIEKAIDDLMQRRVGKKQTVILDNCSQKQSGYVCESIYENGYDCQLITIYYDPREDVDSGTEGVVVKVGDVEGVVESILDSVSDISSEERDMIVEFSGGFPLMAKIMVENHNNGIPIVKISKRELFDRMLGLNSNNDSDNDKLKVLTAFSIFKFIGLYGLHEKQGRFIASNRIVTNIRGSEDDNLYLFKEVYGQYSRNEILEREGNLVLMRLIPLAIHLCKIWFEKQTTETISELIDQIMAHEDEGTKNMLIESLSRRITLLTDVPLAKELNDGLTDVDKSPFLSEEVVLTPLGSRLFLAFSEVNPEACAFSLFRLLINKSDEEIRAIEPARRNLVWALDHMAFDKEGFKNAMFTLARLSLVETEDYWANNASGLFVDRFPILLAGTEVDLMSRLSVLRELSTDERYKVLVKKSLHRALGLGHFHRTGGAEKQGTKTLKDYIPTYREVLDYFNACLDMLLRMADNQQEIDEISKILTDNACNYYLQGFDDFLMRGLDEIAPRRNFIWEEMNDALASVIKYSAPKRKNYRVQEFEEWRKKLTKDDYVYRLLNSSKEIFRNYTDSFEQLQREIRNRYEELAKELIDKEYFRDDTVMSGVMTGQCHYYNSYAITLSAYSKEKGVQEELLKKIKDKVLNEEVSRDGESLLIYFLINVGNRTLLEKTYEDVAKSPKKKLLPAMYAIKAEGEEKKNQLFELLDCGELDIDDFSGYFNYLLLTDYDVKYVANKLLDYGADAARIVLSHCHYLFLEEEDLDEEYQAIARKCLMSIDLNGIMMDDYVFFQSLGKYLAKHQDAEMALHVHAIQEETLADIRFRDNYYQGRLYRDVLMKYKEILIPRIFELLERKEVRHLWIDFLRTSYSQDGDEGKPIYSLIPSSVWFEWLYNVDNDKAYTLAMLFSYADSDSANQDMLKLIDNYWCPEVMDAISSRMHTFSWSGTGIPLYKSRIALCEDYITKLTNNEAKAWFRNDITYWKKEIEQELLENAHERAIYK